jgi:hypothetical protein
MINLSKRSWPNLKINPIIFPEGVRKTTKNNSQDTRSSGRDFNPGVPEFDGVLTNRPQRS